MLRSKHAYSSHSTHRGTHTQWQSHQTRSLFATTDATKLTPIYYITLHSSFARPTWDYRPASTGSKAAVHIMQHYSPVASKQTLSRELSFPT